MSWSKTLLHALRFGNFFELLITVEVYIDRISRLMVRSNEREPLKTPMGFREVFCLKDPLAGQ